MKLAILISFSGHGGPERMILNLAEQLAADGHDVDLVTIRRISPHLRPHLPKVNLVPLETCHTWTSLLPLCRYLKSCRPRALLAAKNRANLIAVVARRLVAPGCRLVLREGTTPSAALAGSSPWRRWRHRLPTRWLYPRADAVVAVSEGVRQDVIRLTGMDPRRIVVIPNPVVTPQLTAYSRLPAGHPWFQASSPPVVLGVGRLTRQKDFSTLLRAFAGVRSQVDCRLVILGEGRDRSELYDLASALGIRESVSLPGFTVNPYAYMARASVFVLSSAWEGSPNVLTEALALGTPVVATDCPSGPREILENGRLGHLVPVGSPTDMAAAIRATLANPPVRKPPRSIVERYSGQASARRYLSVMSAAQGETGL